MAMFVLLHFHNQHLVTIMHLSRCLLVDTSARDTNAFHGVWCKCHPIYIPVNHFSLQKFSFALCNATLTFTLCVPLFQCFTHRNLGWKIMVTDSVEDYLKSNPVRQHPDPCPSATSPTPSEEPAVESSSPGVPSPLLLLTSLLLLSSLTVLVR